MSDVAKWGVHGPVETLKKEYATWDPVEDAWLPGEQFTLVSFRADGTIHASETHNPDGSVIHERWLYDDAGRLAEVNSWRNEEPMDRTVYSYDELGRHMQTTGVNHDGSKTELEVCSYDAEGRKTKVQFLSPPVISTAC